MTLRLIHWKCTYDQEWDYEKIATTLFGSNKCLIVAEKLSRNAHVHLQGYTSLSDRQLEDRKNSLSARHWEVLAWESENRRRKEGDSIRGRPRPLKASKRTVDELGFQYECKEDRPPLYSQGFTQEDIIALRQASAEHVEQLKVGLKDHLHNRRYDQDADRAFKRMRLDALDYYETENKRPRPAFQRDVLWAMYSHSQRDDLWKVYVSEKM